MQTSRSLRFLVALLLCIPSPARAQASDDALQKPSKASPAPQDLHQIAEQIPADLRVIDAALDMWSKENNRADGSPVAIKELTQYLKSGSKLQKAAEIGQFTDALGNLIIIGPVGTTPSVSRKTFDQLADVAPAEFWRPFTVK